MTHVRQIATCLTANAGARRLADVFDDFVEMSALSFRNTVESDGYTEREQRYCLVAGGYSREQLNRFAEALALLALTMEEAPGDILGRLYMELDLGNERLGQFFTPFDVARLMAAMTIDDMESQIVERGFAELYEPACGAGAFIVATVQEMRQAGLDHQRQLHVTADDISAQAVYMTYVHLALLHVPAIVYHRNTLTWETFGTWRTPAHLLGGWERKLAVRRNQQKKT